METQEYRIESGEKGKIVVVGRFGINRYFDTDAETFRKVRSMGRNTVAMALLLTWAPLFVPKYLLISAFVCFPLVLLVTTLSYIFQIKALSTSREFAINARPDLLRAEKRNNRQILYIVAAFLAYWEFYSQFTNGASLLAAITFAIGGIFVALLIREKVTRP